MPETLLPIAVLQESKFNPRQSYDAAAMNELAASIKEKGILVPLLVRPLNGGSAYEIVAGHRRFRAAKQVGVADATIPVLVREMTDEEAIEAQVIENDQREDVHPMEQARSYGRMADNYSQAGDKFPIKQIAKKIGRSEWYVAVRLKLLNLLPPFQKLFLKNEIDFSCAIQIARLTEEQQKEVTKWIREGIESDWLARQIQNTFFLTLAKAAFATDDAKLVPAAGACTACPKRSGAAKLLFPDVKGDDTCLDAKCFEHKTHTFIKIQMAAHPDAILLTVGSGYDKPKGEYVWIKAPAKCEDTKEGIVVEVRNDYGEDSRKGKLGQLLQVCTNQKCKKHWPKSEVSANPRSHRDPAELKREKARKSDLRRRGLIFKGIAAQPLVPTDSDLRQVLDHLIDTFSHDSAKALCDALAWEVTENKYGGKDYTGRIAKELKHLNALDVKKWVVLLTLAHEDLWYFNNSTVVKPKWLEEKAKSAKVDLAECARVSKLTKTQLKAEAGKEGPKPKGKKAA
jgi:ParB family chromosome partitioning protein